MTIQIFKYLYVHKKALNEKKKKKKNVYAFFIKKPHLYMLD